TATTVAVPFKSQTTTAINGIEKSKSALEGNTQVEHQQKRISSTANGMAAEEDDSTPAAPPAGTDFGKKALVSIQNKLY
ncbi:unnamed protein product, partial [Rotaria magnacalcarata]